MNRRGAPRTTVSPLCAVLLLCDLAVQTVSLTALQCGSTVAIPQALNQSSPCFGWYTLQTAEMVPAKVHYISQRQGACTNVPYPQGKTAPNLQVCTEACRREVRDVWVAKLVACAGVGAAQMPLIFARDAPAFARLLDLEDFCVADTCVPRVAARSLLLITVWAW